MHGFHGLRDHSGFLGPLPLSQQPKSRPFTPMGVESIVAASLSHSRDPHEVSTVMQCHYVVVFSVYRTLVTSRKLYLVPHQKAPQRAENRELDLEPAGRRGYLSQKLVFHTKQLLVVNLIRLVEFSATRRTFRSLCPSCGETSRARHRVNLGVPSGQRAYRRLSFREQVLSQFSLCHL